MLPSVLTLFLRFQEGFLASAQQYAQITELAKRVTEWEDKIGPKLQEEVRFFGCLDNVPEQLGFWRRNYSKYCLI